jgi:adenylate cyclase
MRRRRISFATIAVSGLGIFVAVSVGVTLYVSGAASVRSTQALLAEKAGGLLNDLERRINSRLLPVDAQAAAIVKAFADGRVALDRPGQLDAYMDGALAATPQVAALIVADPTGHVRRWRQGEPPSPLEDWSRRPNIAAWVAHGASQSAPSWQPPLWAQESRRIVLLHGAPLRAGDRYLGMLGQVVRISQVSRDLAVFGAEANATPFVLYGADRVLAHPLLANPELRGSSEAEPLPSLQAIGDPVLARLFSPDWRRPFGLRTLANAQAVAATVDGARYVYVYRTLRGFGPEPLILGAYLNVDASGLAAPMKRVVMSIGAGVAVLVAAVLFAAIAGRRLSAPVHAFARVARLVRSGRLDEVPRLPASPIREFDDAASSFNQMVEGLRERKLIRETLGQYLPEEVAHGLLSAGGRLEPVEAKATVLVCDLQDFTLLTDSLGPHGVVEFLNAYFDVMAGIIERHRGVVTQFQGDAILAVFNVPIADPAHAANALGAALEMVRAADTREFAGLRVRNRIGISTGRVVAGAVGSSGRLTYTVHGNAVNLAARLEALNKDYGTRILASGKTAERCPELALRRLGDTEVRGYGDRVELYTMETGTAAASIQAAA